MSETASTLTMQAPAQQHEQRTIQLQRQEDDSAASSEHELPPPPVPASDPQLVTGAEKTTPAAAPSCEETDLFKVPAVEALRLLSASVELLVRMTGDVPPTPPLKTVSDPQMSDMEAEKENIARTHSEQNLALMRQMADAEQRKVEAHNKAIAADSSGFDNQKALTKLQAYNNAMKAQLAAQKNASNHSTGMDPIDGVQLKGQLTSPLSPSSKPEPYIVIGADSQPLNLQHGAITRKFYSKNEPPITIAAYLLRLHQFCPMSTAVYLATSLYINRLAMEERAIPVTRRNAHRLVLAGLRVAMKALEDQSYSHSKVAKVGGVSEVELARLEISFCFLAGFELVVSEERLRKHWESLRGGKAQQILNGMEIPNLRLTRKPRKVNVASDG